MTPERCPRCGSFDLHAAPSGRNAARLRCGHCGWGAVSYETPRYEY